MSALDEVRDMELDTSILDKANEISTGYRLGLCISADVWDSLSDRTREKIDNSTATYEYTDGIMHIWVIHEEYAKVARWIVNDVRTTIGV